MLKFVIWKRMVVNELYGLVTYEEVDICGGVMKKKKWFVCGYGVQRVKEVRDWND